MSSRPLARAAAALLIALPIAAQQPAATDDRTTGLKQLLATEGYVTPPAEVARLVTAPRQDVVSPTNPSPDRTRFLREQSQGAPSLAAMGKPHLYFAGLQVDPAADRGRMMSARAATGLQVIDARSGAVTTVAVPAGVTVSAPTWSPDGRRIAFIGNAPTASHLYVADAATGKVTQLARRALLATTVNTVDWTADGTRLVAVLVPEPRAPRPVPPPVATTPKVETWFEGKKAAERNYWSLLETPHEAQLMAWHVTGQLAVIDVASRKITTVGAPAMFTDVSVAPDGALFRVTTLQQPFSYVVPWQGFPQREELWDATGKVLSTLSKRDVRFAGDTAAPRDQKKGLAWMPTGGGLYYIAGDSARGDSAGRGGAGGANGGARPERVVHWTAPFGEKDVKVLYQHTGPIAQAAFSEDGQLLVVAGTVAGTGELVAVTLAEPTKRMPIARLRGWTPTIQGAGGGFGGGGGRGGVADSIFYANPGALMTRGTARGPAVMRSPDGAAVYLRGTQYSKDYLSQPPREFVDRVTLADGKKTRVWLADSTVSEGLVAVLDDAVSSVVVTRESPTEVPNAYLRDVASGALTKLTNNADPAPTFTALQRKRVWVTRADGIRFLVRVTLPADWKEGTRLPGMFWFYPYEYTSQAEYDRTLRTENVRRFVPAGARSIEFLATQGYAVANFDPPVIGEAGRMNDNYVSDLRMNLYAVIDELDRQGFIDRTRLGLGGHSYGAFSTVNAMVNTPFFKAGIAGDGMYNRTLTPNGFQSERRDLWDAQKTYLDMSPMLNVDKLQGALLLYHSLEDQNVGTDPVSSIRLMQALRGQGKTAALYMYPYEDHGPVARETLLDQWARWVAWLDLYVKGTPAGR